MPAPEPNKRYTYADYCQWDDGKRWELIEGVPYAMSPAPLRRHQRISNKLTYRLNLFLEGKPCQLYYAPTDVRLFAEGDEEDEYVVQPDILVVCDEKKLDDKGVKGAPDFVIEIVSPHSIRHDRIVKYSLYRDAGVKEYWIVEPENKLVTVNVLKDGQYVSSTFCEENVAPVTVLPGCEINLGDVFAEE